MIIRTLILIFLISIVYSCSESSEDYSAIDYEQPKSQTEQSELDETKEDDSLTISKIENEFLKNIKDFDRENGENRLSKFKSLFAKYEIGPYDLYLEISSALKFADDEARKDGGVEINANGEERITEKYYRVLRLTEDSEIAKIKSKYDLDNDLFLQFRSNFCFCYSGKQDDFCNEGTCILRNGKYWSKI